jgi:hypothetical protein
MGFGASCEIGNYRAGEFPYYFLMVMQVAFEQAKSVIRK